MNNNNNNNKNFDNFLIEKGFLLLSPSELKPIFKLMVKESDGYDVWNIIERVLLEEQFLKYKEENKTPDFLSSFSSFETNFFKILQINNILLDNINDMVQTYNDFIFELEERLLDEDLILDLNPIFIDAVVKTFGIKNVSDIGEILSQFNSDNHLCPDYSGD